MCLSFLPPNLGVKLLLPKVHHVFSLGLVLFFLVSIPGLQVLLSLGRWVISCLFCEPQHPCEQVFQSTGEVAAGGRFSQCLIRRVSGGGRTEIQGRGPWLLYTSTFTWQTSCPLNLCVLPAAFWWAAMKGRLRPSWRVTAFSPVVVLMLLPSLLAEQSESVLLYLTTFCLL